MKLFTDVVLGYDQESNKFEVRYHADGVTEFYAASELQTYSDLFEHWYAKVSRSGQRFTREKALDIIVTAYRREQLQETAKKCAVTSAAEAATASSDDTVLDKEVMSARISVMRVPELKALVQKHNLNDSGLKVDLVKRLCDHFKCPLPKKKEKRAPAKHGRKWYTRQTKVNEQVPFADHDFNEQSLRKNLPGFPDKMPA